MDVSLFESEDSDLEVADIFYNSSQETPYPVPAHWHYHIEGIYMLSGSIRVLLNGKELTLRNGELIWFNPKDIHAVYKLNDEPFEYLVMLMPVSVYYPRRQDALLAKYVVPYFAKMPPAHQIIKHSTMLKTGLAKIMTELIDEEKSHDIHRPQAISFMLIRLYLAIIRLWAHNHGIRVFEINQEHGKHSHELLGLFMFLGDHFRENISITELAEVCHMSYSNMAKLFKRLTGSTVNEYIRYLRVEEADSLLLSTDNSVTQIAQATGFSDASHFIATFKRLKGISPKQYRLSFLKG
ncbi:MAG: AraC family transcriptional regulator [Oscillospiraceae bacterium]|nr:AraC family transcriptional regulator [Oscillospiraceae bacterium]MCL2278537.1 AraC family transcriptional regulator [Oscillospiraceae bacterium]